MKNITDLAKRVLTVEAFELLKNKKGQVIAPSLLSGNTKLDKGQAFNLGLAMLPADSLNSYLKPSIKTATVCPTAALHGCDKICIGLYSGHYSMLKGSAHKAQLKRSIIYQFDSELFTRLLNAEICAAAGMAIANKTTANIRLDVFSDNKGSNMQFINQFNDNFGILKSAINFYDYSKITTIRNSGTSNDYLDNIALSVSKNALNGKLFNNYAKNLPNFNYSAIVVEESQVQETIESLNNINNLTAVNGDLFDNFTEHKNRIKSKNDHIVLVLKGKAAKNSKKTEVAEDFALTSQESYDFYNSILNRIF